MGVRLSEAKTVRRQGGVGFLTHTDLVNRILLKFSVRPDLTLFKLATGVGRSLYGKRVIRFGILGGSDIVGIMKPTGRFVAIEVKIPPDDLDDDQRTFRDVVLAHGGIHIVARCEADVARGLDQ